MCFFLCLFVCLFVGSFNMTVVEEKPDRASMYGQMADGAHIAILLKEEGGKDQLAVAVKSPENPLCEGLLRELADLFKERERK